MTLAVETDPSVQDAANRSGNADRDRSPTILAAGAVLLMLVPYLPDFAFSSLTVRLALLVPMAGWGFVELARLAAEGDRPARWAGALVVWGLVASLLSPEPRLATFAQMASDQDWLAQASFIAWWAIGRSLPTSARRPVGIALLVGLAANAALAVAQIGVQGTGLLALAADRGVGFASSPVYLGALMGGGLALVATLIGRCRASWWPWLAAMALLAAGAEASGSRSALLIGVPLAVAATWRAGWKRVLGVVLAILVGVGSVLVLSATATTKGATSVDRLQSNDAGGGVGTRTAMWAAGIEAAGERPVTGWGDGRFRSATSPRATAEFAANEGPDKLFFNAHNIFVERLVAEGIIGLVLLLGFLRASVGRISGPLAWFATAVALSWLVEPVSVITAPVTVLCIGLAWARPVALESSGVVRTRKVLPTITLVVLVTLGIAQGARVLVAAHALDDAERTLSVASIENARSMFPDDPALSDTEAQLHAALSDRTGLRSHGVAALDAARRTVELEPTRHIWWGNLARYEYLFGPGDDAQRNERATVYVDRGLERYRWSVGLLSLRLELADLRGDDATVAAATEDLCAIGSCPPS